MVKIKKSVDINVRFTPQAVFEMDAVVKARHTYESRSDLIRKAVANLISSCSSSDNEKAGAVT